MTDKAEKLEFKNIKLTKEKIQELLDKNNKY